MRVHHYLSTVLGTQAKVAVLRTLFEQSEHEYTARELSLRAGVGWESGRRAIKALLVESVILMRVEGNAYYLSLNKSCRAHTGLRGLFKEEHDSRSSFLRELLRLVPEEASCCLLFGSVARREEKDGSDIDLLLLVKDARAKSRLWGKLPVLLESQSMPLSWHPFTQSEFLRKKDAQLFKDIRRCYEVVKGEDPWKRSESSAHSPRIISRKRKSAHP